jgi:GGDEF domain-containing protein
VSEVIATLILPWFPIVLAVGVGARLLDRTRGTGFGILAALFWVVLTLAATGPVVLAQTWSAAALAAGSLAIVAMGAWSSSAKSPWPARDGDVAEASDDERRNVSDGCGPLSEALTRFDDWLEVHRYVADPWPEFAELLRVLLYDLCGATHVHPYRVLSEGDGLVPMRAIGPGETPDVVSAREGIVGHVVTSGRGYIAGDETQGQLVARLAEESGEQIDWCFAIRQGPRRIGLVRVEHLPDESKASKSLLTAAEEMVCLFWNTLSEVCRSRVAETRDPASGLLTREPFLIEADRILTASYAHNEPVAVAVFSFEGTRALCDRGDWELADRLIRDASTLLEDRVRADDRLGRFDDSRFVVLLRRVDSALGRLIVEQLLVQLTELCDDRGRWGGRVTVRCGLSGSGTEHPILSKLISRAVARCNEARQAGVRVASDLEPQGELAGAATGGGSAE